MRTMTPSAAIGVAVVLALVARTPGRNQQARSPGVLQSASSSPTASGTDHQVGLLHDLVTVGVSGRGRSLHVHSATGAAGSGRAAAVSLRHGGAAASGLGFG